MLCYNTLIMESLLTILQLVSAVLLTVTVLLQQSGAGIGVLGGGADDSIQNTRRGSERVLLQATIVLGVVFVGSNIASLFV